MKFFFTYLNRNARMWIVNFGQTKFKQYKYMNPEAAYTRRHIDKYYLVDFHRITAAQFALGMALCPWTIRR